jgi:putative DNA primase/helicase
VIDKNATKRPPDFSDEALALQFAGRHAGEWRYVAAFGKWFVYDGMRWRMDETLEVFHLIRLICREAAAECRKNGLALSLASASTVRAVELLARSDRRLAATTDQWDQDLWALNTPSGIVDLKTGIVRLHRAEDFMTRLAGTPPDPLCPITSWLRFLDRVCGGSAELIAFLQRMAGYALTGSTAEHALFFLYGTCTVLLVWNGSERQIDVPQRAYIRLR